jgi:bifunctional DNase/RNase
MVEVTIKGLVPTPAGAAVFLGSGEKVMSLFIDAMVSHALKMCLEGETAPRPLTHDLMLSMMEGLGVSLKRVVIHDLQEDVYFARLHVEQSNEIGRSMMEIDARPSDSLVLACKLRVPVFVDHSVWERSEDMSWALDQMDPDSGSG